jgi:NADH-quinone oxidoreductase subunit L
MKTIVALIPILPLISFILIGTFYKNIHKKITPYFACGSVFLSFILSVILFINIKSGAATSYAITLFNWLPLQSAPIGFSFTVDALSSLMLLVVTGVGFLIHLYSVGYMHNDEGFNRFFAYMNLFVFSMLMLVMGSNYLIMFIGWEGVGLCSYLLIGFWYKNDEYNNAAKKAFIMNRIGDLGFLVGLFLLYFKFHSLNFDTIFEASKQLSVGDPVVTAATLLLFVGATGKSAQIPLLTWLPDAMAGPTPVSALIHAATMVTAGIYLVVRSQALYVLAPITMTIIVVVGIATAFLAASIAIYQNDIKKVLAYSTVSQLGYMFVGAGVGAFSGAMFHLTTHAFFKALLFLAAGSVIHALSGEQDIRNMGGLRKKLPITFIVFAIGTLAISGIPPFSGFFSKDEILLGAYQYNKILWFAALLTSLMTAFYMFRIFYLTFYGTNRSEAKAFDHAHESPKVMTIPLIALALLAAFGGALNLPALIGGKAGLHHFISPGETEAGALSHATEWMLIAVTVVCVLVMIFFAWYRFVKSGIVPAVDERGKNSIVKLLWKKYYLDEIYNTIIIKPILYISDILFRADKVIVDGAVNKIGQFVLWFGSYTRTIQTGVIGMYLLVMILGIIAFLFLGLIIW